MKGEEYLIVFDPRGIVDAEAKPLAPRVDDLAGMRLGVLDNTKWNANRLLRKTVALIEERAPLAAVSFYRKESFSKDASPALLAAIAADNDIVLTAIGD